LGSKILGWETVGYVEYEKYCQEIIKQRIADGILDAAPIFGDIRKFLSEGYAGAYQGMVDVVTGGFPCQPFSVAGKGLAENDPRNMWPQTIAVIRAVRPRYSFLENVPGLLSHDYIRTVFGDLAESGYNCRWDVIGASDVGANHRRKRLWILAYSTNNGFNRNDKTCIFEGKILQDKKQSRNRGSGRIERCCKNVPDPNKTGCLQQCGSESSEQEYSTIKFGGWWQSEPSVGRLAHGMAHRVDRLKAIGNGQVPLCMAYSFSKLSEGIIE